MNKSFPLVQLSNRFVAPLRKFIQDSRAVGIVLIGCTVLSMVLANWTVTSASYLAFWEKPIHFGSGLLHLPETTLEWINDVLMTLFFFVVGTEIKRELTKGELASVKKSLLPILAALGGMVVPALIFFAINKDTSFHHGWGIPMATDIAFSLAVLSLLGKKAPIQLKIFLAALAIIDDLGAVVTIALFYTSKIHVAYLIGGVAALGLVLLLNKLKVRQAYLYLVPGVMLWYCLFNSGVHATIAGVIMAFAMPLSRLEKVEPLLNKPVNFLIMPLFALANTAIVFPSDFSGALTSTVSFGVMLGLFIGKPIGIFTFSFMAIKSKIAALPSHTTYKQLLGVGMLGGIGFTMSIFTTGLAFDEQFAQVISKVAIIAASVLAGIAGFIYLYRLKPSLAADVHKSVAEKIIKKKQEVVMINASSKEPLAQVLS